MKGLLHFMTVFQHHKMSEMPCDMYQQLSDITTVPKGTTMTYTIHGGSYKNRMLIFLNFICVFNKTQCNQ